MMGKEICILIMWLFVILFMLKQYYDYKRRRKNQKIQLYIIWIMMFLCGCVGSYFVIIK